MPISVDGSVTGTLGDTGGNSVALTSWTPVSNNLVLVAVAMRALLASRVVTSITGNGLTFVQIGSPLNSNQSQFHIELWRGMVASPSAGQITVNFTAGNNLPVAVIAARFSGCDTSGTNGSGAIEATAETAGPAVDDPDMLFNVTTVTANAWAVAMGSQRAGVFTVPAGDTAGIQINISGGTGGAVTTCDLWYEGPVVTPASTQLGATGDLNSARDWSMKLVSLKPASVALMDWFIETKLPSKEKFEVIGY